MKLVDLTVKGFVEEVASSSPAPGGGSVGAASGALAAGLLEMVCNLTIGRPKFAETEEEMQEIARRGKQLQGQLLELVDRDTEAFNSVMDAYKLPKETEAEKQARSAAIQAANKQAAETPLTGAGLCLEILKMTPVVAEKGNPSAITDIGVAAQMAMAGLQATVLNVRINLGSLKDEAFVSLVASKVERYLQEGSLLLAKTKEIVNSKL